MTDMKHALPYERVKIADLVHDPKNARTHDERNIKAIMASLKMHGQRKPIVLNGNVIVAGNGTVEAARRLGWTTIDANTAGFDEDGYADAYAIQDNRSAELAAWDNSELSQTLQNLESLQFSLDDIGFTAEEINAMSFQFNFNDDENTDKDKKHTLMVMFQDEESQLELFSELRDRGFKVKA